MLYSLGRLCCTLCHYCLKCLFQGLCCEVLLRAAVNVWHVYKMQDVIPKLLAFAERRHCGRLHTAVTPRRWPAADSFRRAPRVRGVFMAFEAPA